MRNTAGARVPDSAARPPGRDRPGDPLRRLAITASVTVLTAVHLIVGSGYVLDDWFAWRNVVFEGAGAAAPSGIALGRPGAALTYDLAFGYAGHNQVVMVLIREALLLAAALLFFALLRRFFADEVPLLVVLLWILLPNHMSLEFWPSALVSSLSLVTLLGACLLLTRPRLGWAGLVLVAVLLATSVLSYESSVVPAAVAALVLPRLANRAFDRRATLVSWAGLAAASLWVVLHWIPGKATQHDLRAYLDVSQAHFGWGIFRYGVAAQIGVLAGLIGVMVVVARAASPARRGSLTAADRLVLAGVAVMLLGSVTFALYFYAPLGAGDRVNYVSSLGGAMVWIGLLWLVWEHRRALAVAAASLLVVGGVAARVERTATWATAAADAERIVEAVGATGSDCTAVYLGPEPIQRQNVAAVLDHSNAEGLVQVALGTRTVHGYVTFDQASFDAAPADCRVDLGALSHLEPDTQVGPT